MLARNNAGRGTARCVASVSPKKLARTLILILGILGLKFAVRDAIPRKHRLGVKQDSAPGAGWARENRYDRARQKRSPRTADRYLGAQWDVVGAALAF